MKKGRRTNLFFIDLRLSWKLTSTGEGDEASKGQLEVKHVLKNYLYKERKKLLLVSFIAPFTSAINTLKENVPGANLCSKKNIKIFVSFYHNYCIQQWIVFILSSHRKLPKCGRFIRIKSWYNDYIWLFSCCINGWRNFSKC